MSNTPFPLTSPQRQIWFDQMLHGDAPVYNIGGYMHLCGPMDGQLFVQATELLVQKHDVLRTVLVADAEGDGQARRQDDGLPQQYHADARLPEIGVLDFSSAPMPHAAALAWMEQEFARPFVLDGGMLCRFALLQLGQDESHVFVCYHHLIADGWAIALLARSHAALYSALLAGTAPDMAAPSYRVFAADDQAYLGSPAFARQADYWRQKFEAPVEKLFAPRHRGQTATGHAGAAGRSQTSTMVLPRHWYNQLGQLAHTQGAGAFHAILAALHVHFTRPFHQPDQSAGPQQRELVVGLPVQNRGNAAFKATAGTFVGMTAARLRFDGGLNFAELLRGIASTLRQDYRHQRYPIQALNEQFSAADGAHRALFDIGLSYERHDHGVGYGQASGVATALTTGYQSTPLMLYVREFRPDQDVLVDFVFNQACFDVAEIAALQQRLRHLLDTALATPLAAISSLPLLTDAELRQVTIDFNRTAIDHGSLEPVFQQFEHQVRRTPLAIALVWEAEHHTYHGLNQLANRLANSLIQAGVLPDELVCIHAARSVEQVAGLLAIMKAGAAYVPLDPDNPAERLAFMLQDSGARWVLAPSQLWLASGLQASACRHLPLDLPALQGFADTNPALDIGTGQLAYMMYTSGSTGKPKGAGISHAALANRLQWMQHSHALTARDRVLQKTPIGFDVSVWEYFWPLMAGATLVVARPGDHQDPARLSAIMAREAVTTMHFVPSMLAAFIEHGGLQDKPALRQVFASGEALSGELARRFLRQSSARLFNLYGPTEAAIDVTAWECQDDGASSVPIGRPIANTQIYLLDEAMRPVPVGTPGKLYIGGVQLARGYHRRPALTAERFVPNPFGAPGTRLYDSGDLACWRSDGAIDYLGRDDDQVKIRGVRIELGEVEAALLSHDGVREAVVVARDDDGHGKRLVAYVVLREEPAPMAGAVAPQMQGGMADADADADPDAGTAVRSTFRSTFCSTSFKQALADRLPQQYVPDHVICLASMPLSRNGKIDRRALPAPRLAMAPPARSSPMDATQKLLATLWRALLGLDDTVPISRQDHFFDLGGHSLLAVRLLAQLRQQAGIELPLRAVFEAPRLEQMAQTIDARRERADCASANAAPEAEMLPALRRADRQSPLPLSFAQQRLWFLDRLEPHGVTYNMAGGLRLSGKLDAVALEAAINTVVQRHDMLRTVFDMAGDSAVQIVKPQAHVCLTVTDLSTLPMPLRQTQAQQLAQNDAMLAFDLRAAPLLRTRLLVLGAREHWLVVSLHHIIADGWSMSVLVRDIAAAYNCHVAGTPMALPALPAQYADFALWQRQLRQTPQWELQLDYWRAQLAGAPALLLPTDHPRPAARTDHGAAFSWQLPAALVQGLRAAGRGQHATLFMTLLSAFGALLSRYSSQDDICIGVPVANRQHAALDGLIGCFVNLLVLRMRFAEGMVFADILRQMRETALAAYANQDIAFEQLVEALRIERDLSHAPLFQVMFTLHEEALGGAMRAPFAGLEQAPLEVRLPVAKFDLSLEMWEDSDGLRARLEYSTDLFEHATIERMAENFGCLLAALAETDNAHVPVARLELITPAQRHFLLEELNQSACAFPLSSSYAALFAQQVALHPQRVAAVCLDERLTYAELDLRSTRLAQALRAAGAAPNVLVGVAGPRDLCYLAMMVAICKAGAAYVPLDVNHPATRLREILVRGRIPMVLVSQLTPAMITQLTGGLETMPVVLDAQAIWLEEDAAAAALPLPALPCGPDDLAYVIFTSGSTGQPKGAMVEQRGMLNNLYGKLPVLGLGAHDRVAQTASPAFDISVWQFLAAPLLGACVHIMPDDVAHDPARLHDALSAQQVTILQVVPNMLRQLGEVAPSDAPLALRWVLSIGEALAPSVAAAWFARFPAIALINIYGPAECADNVTWLALPDAAALAPYAALASVPVGRPTPNTQMFVLDAFLQLLPVGVPGEICIAGAGVGRGYLEDAATTAKAFVDHPFFPGARLYRTGDRGRLRADGVIEYLGRRDQQIKIRGQRLELGEVETRLQRCEGVEEAVAIARTSPLGELQIVAYWAARDMPFAQGMGQAEDALRREMAHHLPPYMVPSQFILLAHLPRNANGKIDRPALARLPWQETSRAFEAPATVLETRMAEIWSAVLGQGGIGRDDNFFALGGHSLLATKAMAHISRAFAVSLPLRAMFESPTLRELAARLALQLQDAPAGATDAGHDAALEGAALDLQPMPVVDRRRSWPLSFSQQRLWIVDQFEQHGALYNMAHAISLQGALDSGLLVAALNDIVARHEVLRTAFERVDGQPVQRIAPFAQLHCPLVDLRHLPADQRTARARQLAAEEGLRPFDLRAAPLLRAQLLCLGEEQHWLLLTVHHIAADAWSSAILARELAAFYHARLHDTAPLLPVLPVQYVDYAVWQQHWQQGSVHQRQLDYWRTELAGAPASLTLPTDHPRPAVNSGRGACIDLQIDGTLAARLQTLALATRTSLFMVLSSVYALLLGRYSAQDDVSVGTPVANRERSEVADLIGFFVNTLVLRFRLHGQSTQSFADLLLQTREMALGAYANQDIAFEQIVQELEPERQGAQTPLFQAMFVLQNGQAATEHFDGLVAHTLDLDPLPVARFDLTLQVTELAQGLAPGAPGLQARFIFNADLFEAQTIERFGQHFHHMLEQVSERPQLALAELDWLRADEKQQILGQWNQTRVTRARDQTIQQLFEACVRRYRDEVAVVFEHQSLSYDELNRRANQLAHHLRALGIGHDDLVCLCIERSIDMVVGILGVLKAGGAYLPLDPAMPATRFASVFASARPRLLLTQQALAARHECGTVPKLCLDDETLWRLPLSQDNPLLRTDPNNLAYVIYTSGTTGQPKGTLIHHGGLTNLVYAQQDAFGVKAGMNVLQWASLTFDAAVSEIFTALTMGARLYLASSDALLPGENLLRTLRHYQIALVTLTPSALAALPLARLPCLKTLVVAGERCDPAIIAPWSQQLTVINAYGPTEVTVCATVHAVAGDARRPPPIGKPIANTQTYILDANLQPVPIGVTGELYLGGEGLARGYLNQPDMTAERFIPNPHSQQAGARLYRTGDLARFLPNGNIDYIGRIDSQVKLRGYRIEPSEIAFALTELPAVAEAVVVMQKTAAGDPRLVAYVVRQQLREPLGTAAEANVCRSVLPAPATAASLRSALLAVLPGYMVPAHFVFVTSLPRNRSGKLDRAALDLVSWSQEDSGVEGALAASASEQQLEPLWCQLLERRQVGRDEDFFALGGHSLLAVRLMARINAAFESILARPMPVSQLFQTPTIGALAAVIDSGRSSARLLVPLKPGRSAGGTPKPPVWLLHPAGGTVFCYRKLAARFYPAWPVHALQSAEMAGLPCTDHDLDSLCRTYMAQISQHQPDGAVHLAGWSLGGVLAFRIAEMLEQAGREIAWVAIFDSLLYQLSQPRRFETFMVWALTSMQGEAWAQSPLDANARQRCAAYLAEHGGAQLERALAAAPDLLQDELGLNTDDVAFFRQQYEVQERQIALIDGFQPGHIKAPLHVFFAHQTDPARRRDSNWLAHTAARAESTMRVVPGTHENLILIEENITCMSRTLGLCA